VTREGLTPGYDELFRAHSYDWPDFRSS
jgi:hypothetical protein